MTITVRLGSELESRLIQLADLEGTTKSALVRKCLEDYLQQQNERKTPWELGKGLFGKHSSGRNDLSTNAKVLVREKVHAKKGRR